MVAGLQLLVMLTGLSGQQSCYVAFATRPDVYTGILLGVPLLAGFIVSRIIADPLFVFVESRAPMAFAPTDAQKVSAPSPAHIEAGVSTRSLRFPSVWH